MARYRIAYVSHVGRLGGAELSLVDLLAELDQDTFEPWVLLPSEGDLSAALTRAGVEFDVVPELRQLHRGGSARQRLGDCGAVARSWVAIDRLVSRRPTALLHANSTTAALFAAGPGLRRGIPVVWHVRDVVRLGSWARLLTRTCARIVAVSRCAARVVERSSSHGTVLQIHNGIEVDRFGRGSRARGRRELGFGDGPVVLSIGQLVAWKNYGILVDAAALVHRRNPAVRFAIIGEGGSEDCELQREIRAKIARERVADVVRLFGFRSDIPDLLAAADLVVHAAYPEPFGRVIVEAMAAGKPVVAVRGDHGPAEILRHGIDGVLVELRVSEFAEAILRFTESQAGDGSKARRRATELFSRSVMAGRMMDVYLETLHAAD